MRSTFIDCAVAVLLAALLATGCQSHDHDNSSQVDDSPSAGSVDGSGNSDPSGDPMNDPEDTTQDKSTIGSSALVDTISFGMTKRLPPDLRVTITGNLRSGCDMLTGIRQKNGAAGTIRFIVDVERPEDMMCTQALVPFTETVDLDTKGLAPGTYTLQAGQATTQANLTPSMLDR